MRPDDPREGQEGCFVCGSPDAAVIQLDRPVVYLCECSRCGKWIIGARALTALRHDAWFEPRREGISKVIRERFDRSRLPVEIIENGSKGTTKSVITVGQLLMLAR